MTNPAINLKATIIFILFLNFWFCNLVEPDSQKTLEVNIIGSFTKQELSEFHVLNIDTGILDLKEGYFIVEVHNKSDGDIFLPCSQNSIYFPSIVDGFIKGENGSLIFNGRAFFDSFNPIEKVKVGNGDQAKMLSLFHYPLSSDIIELKFEYQVDTSSEDFTPILVRYQVDGFQLKEKILD